MKRLTARNKDGQAYYPECFDACGGDPDPEECYSCNMIDKYCTALADYEDIGLEPEQIREKLGILEKLYGAIIEIEIHEPVAMSHYRQQYINRFMRKE